MNDQITELERRMHEHRSTQTEISRLQTRVRKLETLLVGFCEVFFSQSEELAQRALELLSEEEE